MNFRTTASRALRVLAAVGALAALASCGGGGGLVEPFVPTRIVAFGDELSTITADGRKYAINAFKVTDATTTPPTESTTVLDCTRNPIWIQSVAAAFGLRFDRCLGTATTATGQVLAQPGAKVADFAAQVAAVQGGALGATDIAIAMFGMNDILELYGRYPTSTREQLLSEARTRGNALGAQVNAIATAGTPIVILTVPDLGLSPYALQQNTDTGDATRAALLSELVAAFNNRMSVTLINDGRLIGLVYTDIEMQTQVKFPSAYGLANVTAAACNAGVAAQDCTTSTLVSGATSTNYLWATATLPGPSFQARMGTQAAFRARNNPF